MVISFVNTTTATSETTAAVVNNVPTGVQAGDLLLWRYSATNNTREAVPAGWVVELEQTTTAAVMSVWSRIATSEPASYSTGPVTTGRHIGIMAAYRGVDPDNPLDVDSPLMIAGTTTITCPAITPVSVGAWVLGFAAANVAAGVVDTVWASTNLTIAGQTTTTSGPSNNSTGAIGHTTWTSGAVTPAWSASNATLRTLGTTAALRPAIDPQAALIAATQGRTLTAVTKSRTLTAATFDRTLPCEET